MIKYIDKEFVSPKGAVLRVHYVNGVRTVRNPQGALSFVATVQSFGTLDGLLNESTPTETNSYVLGPLHDTVFNELIYDRVYQVMLGDQDSLYFGGRLELVDLGSATLEQAKLAKWEQVKIWRSNEINTNMETPYGVIQCQPEDRQNITDAILLAQTLTAQNLPVQIQWTMADNTVVEMDLEMITNVGLLLGQKVQYAHGVARELRNEIDMAKSVAAVEAIVWPTW
jgi:hypothetical protein